MDAKITLSFNAEVIEKAKEFAESHNMSLSRLTEYLYRKLTSKNYQSLEDLPLSDWIGMVAEGDAEYVTKRSSRSAQKKEYYQSKKK
jgi:hypothetical protein